MSEKWRLCCVEGEWGKEVRRKRKWQGGGGEGEEGEGEGEGVAVLLPSLS